MIRFFRHIRQNLVKDNRTTKYLVYAIGEIIFVVIGIIITVQTNNRNNNPTVRSSGVETSSDL